MTNQTPVLLVKRTPWTRAAVMLLQSLYFSAPPPPPTTRAIIPDARPPRCIWNSTWPSLTVRRAISKRSHEEIGDCEQSDIGGFKIKGSTISGSSDNLNEKEITSETYALTEKVLGGCWRPVEDLFCFMVKLNFSGRKRKLHTKSDIESHQLTDWFPAKLSKRMISSRINSIYDPIGLAGPFTVRAKIIMRKLWMSEAERLSWDNPVSDECRAGWNTFFLDLFIMNNIWKCGRCLKPTNAVCDPMLLVFSDGSNSVYGAWAYVRWALKGGEIESRLAISKNLLAPVKKISIDRIALCGALQSKRLKSGCQ